MCTFNQAEARLTLWGEYQRVKKDASLRGHRGKSSYLGRRGGRCFKTELPGQPTAEEVAREAAAVEKVLDDVAPSFRRLLRLKFLQGLPDEVARTCLYKKTVLSEEDFRYLRRHAVEAVAIRFSAGGAQNQSVANGEISVVDCCNDQCAWSGLSSECVTPKHQSEKLLCPECYETVEPVHY